MIQDIDWIVSLGNAFAKQYELYTSEDEHSALLHRYLTDSLPGDSSGWIYKNLLAYIVIELRNCTYKCKAIKGVIYLIKGLL